MITVRRAEQGDAAAMGRIYVDAWRDTYPGLLPDEGLLAMSPERQAFAWARTISRQSEDNFVLVAERNRYGLVGLVSAGRCRDRDARHDGEVYTLYVDPNHQRSGAGRALLEHVFAKLRGADCRDAIIWALAGNPARTFYEQVGGVVVAHRQAETFGASHEEVGFEFPGLCLRQPESVMRS